MASASCHTITHTGVKFKQYNTSWIIDFIGEAPFAKVFFNNFAIKGFAKHFYHHSFNSNKNYYTTQIEHKDK